MRAGLVSGRIAIIDELVAGREQAAAASPQLGRLIVESAVEDPRVSRPENRIGSKRRKIGFRRMEVRGEGDCSEWHHPPAAAYPDLAGNFAL